MGEICGRLFRLGLCFGHFIYILIDEQVAFDALVIFPFFYEEVDALAIILVITR